MERSITIRFYDVERTDPARPALKDLLDNIAALPLADRERRIDDDILVRLEDYADEGDCVCGQFVRGQTGGVPGQMTQEGTTNLPFEEPLGHSIAFRYRHGDGLLAVQFDNRVLSPSRIHEFLCAHHARAEFVMTPRMRADAVERFEQLPIRKLEVSVSGPPNVEDAERDGDSVWSNVARMKRRYDADTVRFQISMGHRGGALDDSVKQIGREALQRIQGNTGDIRALKGTLDTGAGVPNDEVDLMGQIFDVKVDLNVAERDVRRFYQLRYETLRDRINLL